MKVRDGEIELSQAEVFEAVREYVRGRGYPHAETVSVTALPIYWGLEYGQERLSATVWAPKPKEFDESNREAFIDDLVEQNKEALRGLARDD